MKTRIRNLDFIHILTNSVAKCDFSKSSDNKKTSISLYEYNDYWKVSWFIKGDKLVCFRIFPKKIIENIEYGVKI